METTPEVNVITRYAEEVQHARTKDYQTTGIGGASPNETRSDQ